MNGHPGTRRPSPLVPAVLAGLLLLAGCGPSASAPAAAPTAAATSAAAKPAATTAAAPAASPGAVASPAAAASPAASPAAATSPAAAAASPVAAPSGNLERVTYATTTGSSTSAGVYIAIARGYFTEVGLNVEIVPFGGGADMISTIATSQVDIANTDSGAGLLNAMARNVPIRFTADGARCIQGKCNSALVVRKDLADSGKFKDVPDLKGMNVNLYTPGSTIYMFTLRTMEKYGLTKDDVKDQNLAFADVLPAFSSKALDANFLIEPFTTLAVAQNLGVKFKDTAQLIGDQQATLIVYSPNFAQQRQDAGKRFMVAYIRGLRDFIDAFSTGKDQDQVIQILTTNTTLKDPNLWKNVPQWFDANGAILTDALKSAQDWYVKNGYIQTPVNIDQAWDPTYVDYATSVLGKR